MNTEKNLRFEQEALPHMKALYGLALKYTHSENEAEDLVQEVMYKAYHSFESFDDGTNCRALLFRILSNTFINKFRHKKREREFIANILNENEPRELETSESTESVLENTETASGKNYFYAFSDEIMHAFNSISSEFKTIIIMADIQELSYKEIAQKLRIPMGTVMSRLSRARQMLRNVLGDYAVSLGYAR